MHDGVWQSPRILEDLAWYPNEQIVRFVAKYLKKRWGVDSWDVRRAVRGVLDLGCGTGRHVKLFAEQGFEVHGVDISWVSLRLGGEWLRSLNLPVRLVAGSGLALPYAAGSFDVVVSHGVLDHMTVARARAAVGEVQRVLRPAGLFYLDLISKRDSGYGKGREVEADTFVVPDGIEEGAVQHFFDEAGIESLLSPRFLIDDTVFQEWYPVVGRGMSNLDKPDSGPLTLARYHVVASRNTGISPGAA